MKIIIGGDLVPTKNNIKYFIRGNLDKLLDENLQEKWFSADIRLFNLETPLTDEHFPIDKNGPHLSASINTINGIKKLKPSLISLANNHIMDHGFQGYKSTVNLLSDNSIPWVGSGKNLKSALKPYIINKNGKNIGIYSCAENEFTIATEDKAGANPFNPLESLDHIQELNQICDYLIVLYHGGKEHYKYPSPNLQKRCRKMVEKGGDLILCQHSHCIGSFEEYNNSTILYGQGNFIFNNKDNECWNTGLLVKVDLNRTSNKIEYIPFKTTLTGITMLNINEKKEIMKYFHKRSNKILDADFVKEKYKNYAIDNINKYLRVFKGFGKWLSRIDRILLNGWLIKNLYDLDKLLKLLNYCQCESHRELIIEGIKSYIDTRIN